MIAFVNKKTNNQDPNNKTIIFWLNSDIVGATQ
jgi:hypothetical protein